MKRADLRQALTHHDKLCLDLEDLANQLYLYAVDFDNSEYFYKILQKAERLSVDYYCYLNCQAEYEGKFVALTPYELRDFFDEIADRACEYWSEEPNSGCSMHIDVDRVVAEVAVADLQELFGKAGL
jgi:hypothetical protein